MDLFSSRNKTTNVTATDRKLAGRPVFLSESSNIQSRPIPINEGQVGQTQEDFLTYGDFKDQSIATWTENNYSLMGSIQSAYGKVLTTRQQYTQICKELDRDYYVYSTIIKAVAGDLCNPDSKHDTFRFKSKNEKCEKALNDLSAKLNLNRMIQQFSKDYVSMGDQTLKTQVVKGKGLVSLREHDDQVLAVYENGAPKNYLLMEFKQRTLSVKPAYEYVHFVGNDNKIKLTANEAISDLFGQVGFDNVRDISPKVRDAMGDCARYGLPFYWGVLPAIRNLQLLEALVPALKINQASQQQFVQVKMQQTTDMKSLKAMLAKYDQVLNTPFAIDFTKKQVSPMEMIPILGRIRTLPSFVENDKGAFNMVDLRKDQSVDDLTQNANILRRLICGSLGVPVSVIFGAEEGGKNKADEMRLWSRYTRMLENLQYGIEQGLMQIALIHCRNTEEFSSITKEDIEVEFLQPLTDIGDIEGAEFDNAKMGLVKEALLFAKEVLADPLMSLVVDRVKLVKWLQTKFGDLNEGDDLFLKESEWDKEAIQQLVTSLPPMPDASGDPIGNGQPNLPPVPTVSNGNGNGKNGNGKN